MKEVSTKIWSQSDNKYYFFNFSNCYLYRNELENCLLSGEEQLLYIGIEDKFKKPVYEGDIIIHRYGVGIVKYIELQFGVEPNDYQDWAQGEWFEGRVQIIGNQKEGITVDRSTLELEELQALSKFEQYLISKL